MSAGKLNYIQCDKRGYHFGEYVNMVCMEKSCIDNLACCCACVEEYHKDHETKPLKAIVKLALQQESSSKKIQFNIDEMIESIRLSQEFTIENIKKQRQQINDSFDKIQDYIKNYYDSMMEQIKIKSCDSKKQIDIIVKNINNNPSNSQLVEMVKKLTCFIEARDLENPEMTEQDLSDSIKISNQQIKDITLKTLSEARFKIKEFGEILCTKINTHNIWKQCSYKFSQIYKHQNVKIISDTIAKSVNFSGYKFAVLQPNLEKGGKIKNITFKIKQCTSNWVSIGMCHRKIVQKKNFGFNFGGIGHGGYMVSANGACWSNTNAEMNNSIKCFKFVKGDIIKMKVDFETNKIQFTKNFQKFELQFKKIADDELYPCALFYYINDEVEYLNDTLMEAGQ